MTEHINPKMQKTNAHSSSDARILSDLNHMEDYNGFPDNEFDRATWAEPQHETEEKMKEPLVSDDKDKTWSSEAKATESGFSDGGWGHLRFSDGGWGHLSRFPWKLLPARMCFRDPCTRDSDCCQMFNLCDRSAKICTDCWNYSSCISEAQCCEKYPYCKRDPSASDSEPSGRCVKHL